MGVTLTQKPGLLRIPGQVGVRGDRPITEEDIARAGTTGSAPLAASLDGESYVFTPEVV